MIFDHEEGFVTAKEFVDFFQNHSFFQTRRIWEANSVGRGGHIYRGQANSNWKLIPSAFRSHDALTNFTPQTCGKYSGDKKLLWLGYHIHSELRAVFLFLEAADKLGIETPIDYSRVKDHYDLLSAALNEEKIDYSLPFPNEKTLEDLAIAQHHGIPTRILDWTESSLIACFFSAIKVSSITAEENREKSETISVICFNTNHFTKSNEIVRVNAPRHRNNFLRIQKGVFTHMPKANQYFIDHEKWPSVEDIVNDTKDLNRALKKYTLPASEADDLLRLLYNHDISVHQLMPTLDNIANSYLYTAKLFQRT